MSKTERFRERIREAAGKAGFSLDPPQLERLAAYFELLARWNRTINLTALPLDRLPERTLNRLVVEPLQAAARVENAPLQWFDLGSGGGSPAVPLKIARPLLRLTMVESRSRKVAFLNEVVRFLQLTDTSILLARIEELATPRRRGTLDMVTVRAVKADESLFRTAAALLRPGGDLLLFGSKPVRVERFGLNQVDEIELSGGESMLHMLRKSV